MTILNLRKAISLYTLLVDHFPLSYDVNIYDFVDSVLDNIIKSERYEDFIIALSIMQDKSKDEVMKMTSEESAKAFADGLIENDIVYLIEFCRSINYATK